MEKNQEWTVKRRERTINFLLLRSVRNDFNRAKVANGQNLGHLIDVVRPNVRFSVVEIVLSCHKKVTQFEFSSLFRNVYELSVELSHFQLHLADLTL